MADIISVSALNTYARSLLEGDAALADIAVEGEISNFSRNYKTGHCYFSLKDTRAAVKAVMFRTSADNLAFSPENGMRVVVRGRVSLYERDGAFQIYAEFMFPKGQGAELLALEQLKRRLAAEGLFDEALKRPLPPWPGRVALITSKTGAALQDILHVAQRRCPLVRFLLLPVTVQGERGVGEVATALGAVAGLSADLVIVARGGGSAEDLSVFNAEAVVRAARACPVPVVSAVGHETDVTLLDFAADLRAATPSAAAEVALPNLREAGAGILNVYRNIANNMQFLLDSWYNDLGRLARGVENAAGEKLARAERRLERAAALAASLNPYGVLARGYAIVNGPNGALQGAREAHNGDDVEIWMRDGSLDCRVTGVHEGRAKLRESD